MAHRAASRAPSILSHLVSRRWSADEFAPATSSVASSLTKFQRIVTIPFDATHGSTASLQAGDRVDVYAMFNLVPVNANGTPNGTTGAKTVLRMIMSNVYIAGIND